VSEKKPKVLDGVEHLNSYPNTKGKRKREIEGKSTKNRKRGVLGCMRKAGSRERSGEKGQIKEE